MPVSSLDCGAYALPVANAADCITIIQGELKKLYWTANRSIFNDGFVDQAAFDTLANWTPRLNNATAMPTTAVAAPIRYCEIIGGLAKPEQSEIKIEGGRSIYSVPSYTVPFVMHDISAAMINWIRHTQTNAGQFYRVWLASDARMLGGISGIKATMKFDLEIANEIDGMWTISGEVKFKLALPAIDVNPLA
jgi:hypothetical protein